MNLCFLLHSMTRDRLNTQTCLRLELKLYLRFSTLKQKNYRYVVTSQPFSATQSMWLLYCYECDWHFSTSALLLRGTLQPEWKGPMIIEPAGWGRGREQLRHILARVSSSSSRRNSGSHCLCTSRGRQLSANCQLPVNTQIKTQPPLWGFSDLGEMAGECCRGRGLLAVHG